MADFGFVNAYAVRTSTTPAGRESNKHDINLSTPLGAASIDDANGASNLFSGNDVPAIGINIPDGLGGFNTYYGWISRPVKVGGEVQGFYFWTDINFTSLAVATADGNQDGDGSTADNLGFILVTNQSYFDGLGSGFVQIGSSSDRVDAQLNSMQPPVAAPVANADVANGAPGASGGAAREAGHNVSTADATGNVLENDTDANGDPLSVVSVSGSSETDAVTSGTPETVAGLYGSLTLNSTGAYTYVLNNASSAVQALLPGNTLTDSFSYTISDGNGGRATTTLAVTINGSNDAPTAGGDYAIAKEITTGTGAQAGITPSGNVLTNDLDVDRYAEQLSLTGSSTSTTGGTSGSYAMLFVSNDTSFATGKFLYVGTTALLDTDGVQLKSGTLSADKLTLTLSGTPNAASLALLDGANSVFLYTNAGGNGLSSTITSSSGYSVGAPSSSIVEVASVAGIAIGATMTWSGGSATVASVDSVNSTVTLNSPVSVTPGSDLNFGRTISGGSMTLAGKHGTLVLGFDGSYTYTPFTNDATIGTGDSPTETFSYTMQDAAGVTSSSTLTITVYGSGAADPTAGNDIAIATEQGVAAGTNPSAALPGVLANDSGASKSVTYVSSPVEAAAISGATAIDGRYGTLTMNSNGSYSYVLDNANSTVNALQGGSLADVFQYRMTNSGGGTAVATLTITINGADDAPVAMSDVGAALEQGGLANAAAGLDASGNVLSNDTDVDDAASALKVTAVAGVTGNVGASVAGTYGSLTLNADGSWSYAVDNDSALVNGLAAGSTVTDSFTYTVAGQNGAGASSVSTLVVTVQGASDMLDVSEAFVNEASDFAVFKVYGAEGIAVSLSLGDSGLADNDVVATAAADYVNVLEYYNGSAWVSYNGTSVTLPSSGPLLVRVAINDDTTYEGNEAFTLTAATLSSDGASAIGYGTINDEGTGDIFLPTNTTGTPDATGSDDDRPTVSIDNPTVAEAGTVVFTVSLDRASTQEVNFTPVVTDVSAAQGTDTAVVLTGLEYQAQGSATWTVVGSGPVTIAAGDTYIKLRLATTGDAIAELDETFTLSTGYIADPVQNPDGVTGTATITDDDVAALVVSETALTTNEDGLSNKSFTVALSKQPTGTVTITVANPDAGEGSVSPATLTFTPGNWDEPQTVTVAGADDELIDGDVDYTITLMAAGGGAYDGLVEQVEVSNQDDEVAGITVSQATLTTGEAGSTVSFTVVLDARPLIDVTVTLSGLDATEGSLSATTLTFTPGNWNVAQSVTVTGEDDDQIDGDIDYTLTLTTSGDAAYDGANAQTASVMVTNQDDETAGITVSQATLITGEGGSTASFTVVLDVRPLTDVTVTLSGLDATEGSLSATTLTFTPDNWNVAQNVTVTGEDDDQTDGNIDYALTLTTSGDAAYDGANAQTASVTVTNQDDEAAGITVSQATLTTNENGSAASFTVVLDARPLTDVTVTLSGLDASEGILSNTTLTFTPDNWNVAQSVTVTGEDDDQTDGDIDYTLTLTTSGDAAYDGANAQTASVTVTNQDDEAAGITVSQATLTTNEDGSAASFTVVLGARPLTDVTVTLSGLDGSEGSLSVTTLTFTPDNWNVAQSVTVTGEDDDQIDGDIDYTLTLTSSGDAAYDGANAQTATVDVTNEDDEAAGLTVSQATLTTGEGGSTASLTVVLDARPLTDVTVKLSGLDASEGSLSATTLTFTPDNWNVAQNVTVTGEDDDQTDGDIDYALTLTTSGDAAYDGANAQAATVDVTNQDDEAAGITVSQATLTTRENGSTASFTVVLDARPLTDVTVTLSGLDASEGNLSATTLTFTPDNWSVAQSVTVTGEDDDQIDGDIDYTLTLTTSGDAAYDGVNAQTASVVVTNQDDETAGITVSQATLATNEGGSTASFTVVLDARPMTDVTVTLSGLDATEGNLSNTTLTFTPDNWDEPQEVTVTGVNDDQADGDIDYTLTLTTSGDAAYDGANAQTASVTATNQDDEVAGITVSQATLTTSENGSTASFTVVLDARPLTNVTVTLSGLDAGEGNLSNTTLTFTPDNWDESQEVTVTGVNDDQADGHIDYTLTLTTSGDAAYDGANAKSDTVAVTNQDDDVAGLEVSQLTLTTDEQGGAASFEVRLNTQPVDDVVITIGGLDATEGALSTSTLTFTAASWDQAQTVTVTGVDDALVDGDIAYTLTLDGSGDDAYDGLTTDIDVVNEDDDTGGITISRSELVTGEDGSDARFSVRLDSQPVSDVIVTLRGLDPSEGALSSTILTFTAANWNQAQDVRVTGQDDNLVDGNVSYAITASTSGDSAFDGANRKTAVVNVTNVDNDVAAISVQGVSRVSEGGYAVFTVTLSKASVLPVDVALSVADESTGPGDRGDMIAYYYKGVTRFELDVDASGHVTVPERVTSFYVGVATVDDEISEGAESFSLTAALTSGSSSDSAAAIIADDGSGATYDDKGQPTPGQPDDDRPQITVTGTPNVSEGSNAVFTIRLSAPSAAPVEIDLALGFATDSADAADYSGALVAYYFIGDSKQVLTVTDGRISLPPGVTAFHVSVATQSDSPRVYEQTEAFSLRVAIAGGDSASGAATIADDGTGKFYDDKGVDGGGTPDDDRPPPISAGLDPASDDGPSNTDKVTSVIEPRFTIVAGTLLEEGQTVRLVAADGAIVASAPVTAQDVAAGQVSVTSRQLDDGFYVFMAQVLDAAGLLVGEAQVSVTVVTDLDGVQPSVELAANGGDFNGDGIADWSQNNVAQVPLASVADYLAGANAPQSSFGSIMVGTVDPSNPAGAVVLDPTAQLLNLSLVEPPAPVPTGQQQAGPLMNFSVTSQQGAVLQDMDSTREGLQTRVVIDLPTGVLANTFIKWDQATASWFEYLDDGSLVTFDDGATLLDFENDGYIDRVVVTLTDGGRGDSDAQANGIVVDPGMLALKNANAVYSVLLANGDRYYTVDAGEAARMATGTANVFEGVRFDSLDAAMGGRQLFANFNPFTSDWYFATEGDPMPYICYERMPGAGFQAAAAGQGPGSDFHLFLNDAGITQLVTLDEAAALGLAGQGFNDWGTVFTTTTANKFRFDAEGYLAANHGNQGVQNLVQALAGSFASTSDAGFIEAVEQHYLAQVSLVGVAHGADASASDVNLAFGTAFSG